MSVTSAERGYGLIFQITIIINCVGRVVFAEVISFFTRAERHQHHMKGSVAKSTPKHFTFAHFHSYQLPMSF